MLEKDARKSNYINQAEKYLFAYVEMGKIH